MLPQRLIQIIIINIRQLHAVIIFLGPQRNLHPAPAIRGLFRGFRQRYRAGFKDGRLCGRYPPNPSSIFAQILAQQLLLRLQEQRDVLGHGAIQGNPRQRDRLGLKIKMHPQFQGKDGKNNLLNLLMARTMLM